MKLFPRVLLASALISSLSFSGLVNGVAIIINKEPITLYEVYKYAEHFKMTKKEALDLLVRQKLEDAEIKAQGIEADLFEVDNYIKKLAQNNGISEFDFLKMLKSQNIEIETYKNDLKSKIKRDKLYQNIVREKMQPITDKELEDFYNANKSEFEVATSFDVVAYHSSNEEDLKTIIKNPMATPQSVTLKTELLENEKLNPKLQSLLGRTKSGEFSQIIKLENSFLMFYLKEKQGVSYIDFEKAKSSIYSVLYQQQEQKVLSDYFEKAKSSASIEVLRNPS